MNSIHNERTKLTATGLNGLAVGTIIAGGVTPLVAIAYGLRPGAEAPSTGVVVALTLVWISTGIGLHFMARAILGRLRK